MEYRGLVEFVLHGESYAVALLDPVQSAVAAVTASVLMQMSATQLATIFGELSTQVLEAVYFVKLYSVYVDFYFCTVISPCPMVLTMTWLLSVLIIYALMLSVNL